MAKFRNIFTIDSKFIVVCTQKDPISTYLLMSNDIEDFAKRRSNLLSSCDSAMCKINSFITWQLQVLLKDCLTKTLLLRYQNTIIWNHQVIMEGFKFNICVLQQGVSIFIFVAALRHVTELWLSTLTDMLRGSFIYGIIDNHTALVKVKIFLLFWHNLSTHWCYPLWHGNMPCLVQRSIISVHLNFFIWNI